MDKRETQEFSDLMLEWNRVAGIDGFYFTVIAGADFGCVFLLEKIETVLGRSDKADIQVNDEKVSRQHLKISLVKSGARHNDHTHAVITDLNSTNGVFINGVRAYEQELKNGDKLKVGETILKFEAKDHLDVAYHERLYHQASCDSLTGLANRSYLQRELNKFI